MPIYEDIKSLEKEASEITSLIESNEPIYQDLISKDENGVTKDPIGARQLAQKTSEDLDYLDAIAKEKNRLLAQLDTDLKTGKYLTYGFDSPEADADFSEEAIMEKTQKHLSAIVGEDVDVTSGVSIPTRVGAALFENQNVDKYLASKYGAENVMTKNIAGKQTRLVKDESGKWKAVNEYGASLGDVFAGLAKTGKESVKIGASVGGSILFAPVTAGPIGAIGGGAIGYTGGATTVDQALAAIYGVKIPFSESLGKASTEAMLGAGLELGGTAVLAPVARRIGPSLKRESVEEVASAQTRLQQKGFDVNISQLLEYGEKRIPALQRLAADQPSSGPAKDIQYAKDRLDIIRTDQMPKAEKPAAMYQATLDNIRQDAQQTADNLAMYSQDVSNSYLRNKNQQVYDIAYGAGQNIDTLGRNVFNGLQQSKQAIEELKNQTYKSFWSKYNSQIKVDPIELAEFIERKYYKGVKRNPSLQKEIDKLYERRLNSRRIGQINRELKNLQTQPKNTRNKDLVIELNKERASLRSLAGPLNGKQLNDYVRIFAEASPDGELVGKTIGPQTAAKAAENIRTFRDSVFEGIGALNEWKNATSVFQQRLGFNEDAAGRFLRETLDKPEMDETRIVSEILQSPRQIRDTISMLSLGNPQAATQLRSSLKNAYLQEIGVADRLGRSPDSFNFNPEIVETLWGVNSRGEQNSEFGKEMVKKLGRLQDTIRNQNLDPSKITYDDVDRLAGVLSQDSIREVNTSIAKRIKEEQRLDALKNNSLMNMALKGDRSVINSGEFPAAMWSSNIDDVGKFMARMPPQDQKTLREDMIEYVFAKYRANMKNMDQIWDGRALLSDLKKNPKQEKILRRVVGDDFVDTLKDASVVMQVFDTPIATTGSRPGNFVLNEGGFKAYVSPTGISHRFHNYYLRSLYATGKMIPLLRKIANKNVSVEQYRKNIKDAVIKLGTTSEGIEALTNSGRYNPQWAEHLGQLIGVDQETAKEYREKYGIE